MTDERTQAEKDEVRRDRIIWTTLIILGVIVTIAVLTYGWRFIEPRLEAAKKLDAAIAILKTTESTVTTIDDIVRAQPSADTAKRAKAAGELIAPTRTKVAEARDLASSDSVEHLTDDEVKQSALVLAAAKARLELLDASVPVLEAAQTAAVTTDAAAVAAFRKLVDDPASAYFQAHQKAAEADETLKTM